ncbi:MULTISPECIES: MFS transporter [unclassified Microbacterium]|uniref:MFS transporter n=1 Tax=unclassified Microbacterium TaxID=2609290 RepID=UPI00214CA8A8|nr:MULTISPECIES: MFS transporter [unclassified Microbacterium]MCR2786109.1 MFS transporter [Microbacterium sp. zg.B96]WIM17033.1 MFS transporter [Microbacterium sp. zg-B96]
MRGPAVLTPFANGNFSVYFAGQVVSNTGTWFQNLALSLVILQATGSAASLSGVTIAQFLPLLLLSIPAGWLADRVPPRSILLVTSVVSAAIVAALAVTVSEAAPVLPVIYVLVAALGTTHAFERIAAQAIIFEIVGPGALTRAVSLSTIALASARSIGPGLAGIAFQDLGATACMLVNSASFVLVFVSVLLIRPARLHHRPVTTSKAGAPPKPRLRSNRPLVTLLVVNVIVALCALNLLLVLTSTVTLTFAGDATAVGAVHALNAIGAIIGGLIAAGRSIVTVRSLAAASAALGAVLVLNAVAPTLPVLLLLGPVLGLGVGYYQGILYAAAQASVPPEMIGRSMSLVTMGNYGVMPIGALLLGWLIDASSGRVALLVGGIGALLCSVFVAVRTRDHQ